MNLDIDMEIYFFGLKDLNLMIFVSAVHFKNYQYISTIDTISINFDLLLKNKRNNEYL